MKNKVIITTTNTIEGYTIKEYYGYIDASSVIGSGFLAENLATLSDLLGDKSSTMENKIERIKEDVLSILKRKAIERKCNGILGVHIDVDEISSGQKMMFMVTAYGTAVKCTKNGDSLQEESSNDFVLYSELKNKYGLKSVNNILSEYILKFKNSDSYSTNEYANILQDIKDNEVNADPKIVILSLIYYPGIQYGIMKDVLESYEPTELFKNFIEVLYDISKDKKEILRFKDNNYFIEFCHYFSNIQDYNLVLEFLKKENKYFDTIVLFSLLEKPKYYYEKKDINLLKSIILQMKSSYWTDEKVTNSNDKICHCGTIVSGNKTCSCGLNDTINYLTYIKKKNTIKALKSLLTMLKKYFESTDDD